MKVARLVAALWLCGSATVVAAPQDEPPAPAAELFAAPELERLAASVEVLLAGAPAADAAGQPGGGRRVGAIGGREQIEL